MCTGTRSAFVFSCSCSLCTAICSWLQAAIERRELHEDLPEGLNCFLQVQAAHCHHWHLAQRRQSRCQPAQAARLQACQQP